jgi:uncharacterized protein
MGHKFAEIAFTSAVRALQEAHGSRRSYARMEQGEDYNDVLGDDEAAFIGARDSFYMATVSETGWPYVQHRGGPIGFVRVLDARTLGFADFRGNRQYVTVGNLRTDDRAALFFMDYPSRLRLKLLGRVTLLEPGSERLAELEIPDYGARVERGFVIRVEAFDWNCSQHITPRFTVAQLRELGVTTVED